jgi:hypothetical protein
MPWDVSSALELDALVIAALTDCTPAMEASERALRDRIEANFDSESAAGDVWDPLKPRTLADRADKGFPPGPILYRTGQLRAVATAVHGHGSDWAEVGAPDDHPYASAHAGSGSHDHVPLRDFLAVDDAFIEGVGSALVEHIEKGG